MAIHELFPYLRARDVEAAIAFYQNAFDATEKFRLTEPSGRVGHAELLFGTATVMIAGEFPEYGIHALESDTRSVCLIHLHVDNADEVIERAVKAGARIMREVEDAFYGERSGTVRDPFGYDWLVGHSIEAVSPEEMQRRYDDLLSEGQTC